MYSTLDIFIVFGIYRIDTKDGRSYNKVPLTATLSEDQARYERELFDAHRDWIPDGGIYLDCSIGTRNVPLYPDVG